MPIPTVLFLGANARDTTRLRLGAELRDIRHELQAAGASEAFRLVAELAVRPRDLQSLLLNHAPEVIHFSGHGIKPQLDHAARTAEWPNEAPEGTSREFVPSEEAASGGHNDSSGGLLLEDEHGAAIAVRPEVLAELLAIVARDTPPRCVVLNACFTASQAQAIAEHVDCVIGTTREIDDPAAMAFAAAFYRAIAHGKSVSTAFELGRVEIGLRFPRGMDVPRLFHRPGVSPDRVFLKEAAPRETRFQPEDEAVGQALELGTIMIDRRATHWIREAARPRTSPFSRPCLFHLRLDPAATATDLPFDVTLLNLAPRPVTLSHIGLEIVEIVPIFDRLTPEEVARSLARGLPAARKVAKEDTILIEGQKILHAMRPQVVKSLRRMHGGEVEPTLVDARAQRGRVIPVGETAWCELDDPVYLEAGAPYRFALVLQDVRDYLPNHLIVRVAARVQLGESRSSPIEICASR